MTFRALRCPTFVIKVYRLDVSVNYCLCVSIANVHAYFGYFLENLRCGYTSSEEYLIK